MRVLGINGGKRTTAEEDVCDVEDHDAAAVLIDDGRLIAAVEEERLDRLKHSSCFPENAIRRCLQIAGASLTEVDWVAVNGMAATHEHIGLRMSLTDSRRPVPSCATSVVNQLFERAFGVDVQAKLRFCHHHHSHGWSAYGLSGFPESVVLSIDGMGDRCSGMVFHGVGRDLRALRELSIQQSLGMLYLGVISLLGFQQHDEYKAMGLAPYGDPSSYRELFGEGYRLLPEGHFEIQPLDLWQKRFHEARLTGYARRKGANFTKVHMDLAAALQQTLEEIVLHVLRYFAKELGSHNLCLAGGVAHNCSLNGKILYADMFENVFVQPAACDAGGALGAAISVACAGSGGSPLYRMSDVYLGGDVGEDSCVEPQLRRWSDFVSFERRDDIVQEAAQMLANGSIIGWVQGRSEFGPRALGNRSILGDPRPAANKLRINKMIKKRESFRPFAPSVLEERLADFFQLPRSCAYYSFMTFVLLVKEEMREKLGAITHVDGTARVQSVSRDTNPKYWSLIAAFGELTGIPMLLNTSFNNFAEPIVDGVNDSIATFLTTALDSLVVGSFLIRRKAISTPLILDRLIPALPRWARLESLSDETQTGKAGGRSFAIGSVKSSLFGRRQIEISKEMFQVLGKADGVRSIQQLAADCSIEPDSLETLSEEGMHLWGERVIQLSPVY